MWVTGLFQRGFWSFSLLCPKDNREISELQSFVLMYRDQDEPALTCSDLCGSWGPPSTAVVVLYKFSVDEVEWHRRKGSDGCIIKLQRKLEPRLWLVLTSVVENEGLWDIYHADLVGGRPQALWMYELVCVQTAAAWRKVLWLPGGVGNENDCIPDPRRTCVWNLSRISLVTEGKVWTNFAFEISTGEKKEQTHRWPKHRNVGRVMRHGPTQMILANRLSTRNKVKQLFEDMSSLHLQGVLVSFSLSLNVSFHCLELLLFACWWNPHWRFLLSRSRSDAAVSCPDLELESWNCRAPNSHSTQANILTANFTNC